MIPNLLPTTPTTHNRSPGILRFALAYADAGLPVFPCQVGGKAPLTRHGFHDATCEATQIRRWWTRTPGANIGLVTGSGVDVVDIDLRDSGHGYTHLHELKAMGLLEGWAQAVRTPSGGMHLYYPTDPDGPQGSWSRGKAHVDFRGTGGYIIAPGSTIHIGNKLVGYQVIAHRPRGLPVDGDAILSHLTPPMKTIGPRAFGMVGTRASAHSRAKRVADWASHLSEGERNTGLFWAACRLVELGLSESDTVEWLAPPASSVGLGEREIRAVVRSAHTTAIPLVGEAAPVARALV